jgi:hypothetical protein
MMPHMVTCRPYSQETLAQDAHTLPWGLTQQVIDDEVDAVFESKKKKKKKTKEVSPDTHHAHPNDCASRLYIKTCLGDGSLYRNVHSVGPSQSMILC